MIYIYLFLTALASNTLGYMDFSYKKKLAISFAVCALITYAAGFFLEDWDFIPIFLISYPCFIAMMSVVHFGEIYFRKNKE